MSHLTIVDIEKIAMYGEKFVIDSTTKQNIERSFAFLNEFASDRIIYGINTGFGPMAQFKIDEKNLNELQYNLIRSHSSGTGQALSEEDARAVVLARMNNFLQGNSGVSYGVIEKLQQFLNHGITPCIFEHGGVGASGDLVQLAHLGLNLIGEGYVFYGGNKRSTQDVLKELNIDPLKLQLRDGLGLINGTSCMTGIGAINVIYARRLMDWAIASSAIINEVVESFDDSFSQGLNEVKLHPGQQKVAEKMRLVLEKSQLIKNRKELQEDTEEKNRSEFKKKIQEYYSIRCVPQILGPVLETIENAALVLERELNSTNDNPIVSEQHQEVFHGGNFHGDYVSLEMDKLKIVVTKLTMLAERQLNYLLNAKLNDQYPPFLNAKTLGLNFGIQGVQFTATSTTAENQMLSNPMYVHSIPNNNDNQDIVSMGTNSAIICKRVLENAYQVMAIHMLSVCQAVDLLPEDKKAKLAPKSKEIYSLIRSKAKFVEEDLPQFEVISELTQLLKRTPLSL